MAGWRRRPSGLQVPRVADDSEADHIPKAEGFERVGLIGERNRECEISVDYDTGDVVVHLATKDYELPVGFHPDEGDRIAELIQQAADLGRRRRKIL